MTGGFGSPILDVVIGLSYVFLLLALLCTTINEWIAGIFHSRGKMLQTALRQLLGGQAHSDARVASGASGFFEVVTGHPLIANLGSKEKNQLPSYIAPKAFVAAVMDAATVGQVGVRTFADFQAGVDGLPEGDIKKTLSAILKTCNGDLELAQERLEAWFNSFMDRVSGWYKRWVQKLTLGVAFVLCLFVGADSIRLTRTLWQNSTLRNILVEQAKTQAAAEEPTVRVDYEGDNAMQPKVTGLEPLTEEAAAAMPQLIGWPGLPKSLGAWALSLFGVVLSTAAVSLGAPFWFDVLKRLVNIRSSGVPPSERAK
jgi:hypothetical protein